MPKYRKKPIVIEAHQLQLENMWEIGRWMNGKFEWVENEVSMIIPTLEGDMVANQGDYIIKGIKGEFYPCKPDIFENSYDPVETAA